jgi:homoserine O-acetyltransferase/O-succinyltransferase
MGKNIPDVTMKTISPGSVNGHASAGGFLPADVEYLDREVSAFLDGVTEGGKSFHYDVRAPKGRTY